ncbi:MAG: hypothetical protein NTY39_04575 [Campylobacterales bacterium]|nr:hypothetical protein [Campylobacterales bacterium]
MKRIQKIIQSPAAAKAVQSMKPEKSVWGFFGIVLFLIVPEIVAFIWGVEITAYAKQELLVATSFIEKQYYNLLVMLFEEGGSWVNIGIGVGLLVWLFF